MDQIKLFRIIREQLIKSWAENINVLESDKLDNLISALNEGLILNYKITKENLFQNLAFFFYIKNLVKIRTRKIVDDLYVSFLSKDEIINLISEVTFNL